MCEFLSALSTMVLAEDGSPAASLPLTGARICRNPQRGPRPEPAVGGNAHRRLAVRIRQGKVAPELPAGADAKLGEHLAPVVLRGPGLMNNRAPISDLGRATASASLLVSGAHRMIR